jgi:hypothetical protein
MNNLYNPGDGPCPAGPRQSCAVATLEQSTDLEVRIDAGRRCDFQENALFVLLAVIR